MSTSPLEIAQQVRQRWSAGLAVVTATLFRKTAHPPDARVCLQSLEAVVSTSAQILSAVDTGAPAAPLVTNLVEAAKARSGVGVAREDETFDASRLVPSRLVCLSPDCGKPVARGAHTAQDAPGF